VYAGRFVRRTVNGRLMRGKEDGSLMRKEHGGLTEKRLTDAMRGDNHAVGRVTHPVG
jgi:hypothetical protein